MKFLIKIAVFCFCCVLLIQSSRARASLQTTELSHDVVFTYSEINQFDPDFKHNRLALFSAKTLNATLFYTDETATHIYPLSWSPSGQLLAIRRFFEADLVVEICIMSKDAQIITCFRERPPLNYASTSFSEAYDLTWSPDESAVYFVSEDVGMRRLIEAQIDTGDTSHVFYETPASTLTS